MERPNLPIMAIEEGGERQIKGINNLYNKLIAKNFPNLDKKKTIQVQEVYGTPNCQDQGRNTPDITIKTLNI
jgi:hypothetical protein